MAKVNKDACFLVWAIICAILTGVFSICYDLMTERDHYWARAGLWTIGAFFVSLFLYGSSQSGKENEEVEKDEKNKEDKSC